LLAWGIGGVLPVIVAQMVGVFAQEDPQPDDGTDDFGLRTGRHPAAVLGKQLIGEYGWQAVFIAAGCPCC
jgi:AAHS family benzoate transporter-like MFS transporter